MKTFTPAVPPAPAPDLEDDRIAAAASPPANLYETERLLAEYLLFHYGTSEEVLPYEFGPREALEYPARCARLCAGGGGRALDLGCAVGRASFELARDHQEVIGIDYS